MHSIHEVIKTQGKLVVIQKQKSPHNKLLQRLLSLRSCRGRGRTSTRQLAIAQSSVVDPGRISIATETALCYVYPVILTPETRGHVCQKVSSPHSVKDLFVVRTIQN
jgi:hypothetical protein